MIGIWLLKKRGLVVAAALVAAVAWRAWDVSNQQAIGGIKTAMKIEKAQHEKRKKAVAARQSVDSIPDKRLRDPYFRD